MLISGWKKPIFNVIDYFSFKQNRFYHFFRDSENWDLDRLKTYQLTKLWEISNVWNLNIKSWDDFYSLPLTTKSDLPTTPPSTSRKGYHTHETSGSTGEPRIIHVPSETWHRKDAIFHRSWAWLGRENQPVLRLMAGKPEFAWYDWWRNETPMNYREITQDHINFLITKKPYLIHGPGGAIRQLCEEVIRAGHENVLKDIKIEWCSESPEGHRERLEPFLSGFYEQYGLAELPTVGSPCPHNTHVVMETGVVEVIDGEIVVSDFNNYLTPIIRYRTGDEGEIRPSDCACGRNHPILYNVKGRRVDYYFGPETKRPIGWWVVSPISHNYSHIISKWKVEVFPKQEKLLLHVVFKDGINFEGLKTYKDWIKENSGLNCEIVQASEASANWKRELVKVILN